MNIKFRGKCISPKYEDESIYLKWIYGDLHHVGEEHFIYSDDSKWHEVDKDAIGQCTGLQGCWNVEAYEGDILKEWFSKYSSKSQSTSYGIIKREKDTCNLYIEWHYEAKYDGETYWDVRELPLRKVKEFLVVGNIYQNKDLLKGED